MVDLFGAIAVVGVACFAMAGVVALVQPINNSRRVATRLAVLGLIFTVGALIARAIANG
jgi:hypothetical protein